MKVKVRYSTAQKEKIINMMNPYSISKMRTQVKCNSVTYNSVKFHPLKSMALNNPFSKKSSVDVRMKEQISA